VVRNVQLHDKQLIRALSGVRGSGSLSIKPVGKTHLATARPGLTKSGLGVQWGCTRPTTFLKSIWDITGSPLPSHGALAPYEAAEERPIYSGVLIRAKS